MPWVTRPRQRRYPVPLTTSSPSIKDGGSPEVSGSGAPSYRVLTVVPRWLTPPRCHDALISSEGDNVQSVSWSRCSPDAAMFSLKWRRDEVPGISTTFGAACKAQASAT